MDEQIVFKSLSEDVVWKILMPMLEEISVDLQIRYNAILRFTEEALSFLVEKRYSPQYGVRELRRTVEKYVKIPLSNLILSSKLKEHNLWLATLENESILFIPAQENNRP